MDLKESFFSINQQHQTGVARLHANCHAQKWFKGQKGQKLEFADIKHHNNIIYAMEQTNRIMKEIGEIGII